MRSPSSSPGSNGRAAVVDAIGLGGFSDAWVSMALFDQTGVSDSISTDELLISLDGEVFDTTKPQTNQAVGAILTVLEGDIDGPTSDAVPGLDDLSLHEAKQDLLQDAEDEGTELTTIFSVVGGFSVLAGALLLINLFVMLAEERKPNLGVLRAIGWKRSALRRAFRVEGVVYAAPAAVVGAVLGIGVGWIIVQLTRGILSAQNPDSSFQLITAVDSSSLLTAGLAGFVIAMLAVWFTSWRISRLNIVSAIRDLPEPKTSRSRVAVAGAGVVAVVIGAICLVVGLSDLNAYIAIISVPLIVIGVVLLVRDLIPPLWLTPIAALIVLGWAVLFFEIMPDDASVTIEFFLPYGVVMVGAGVALATVSGNLLQRLVGRTGSAGVPGRLAMAYPTSRVFRTASSLAMYSLIIFSLAFMAVMASGIETQSSQIVEASSAGHDILVDTNRANPVDPGELGSFDGVSSASAVTRAWTEWSASFDPETVDSPRGSLMTAADATFAEAGAPVLIERDARFATDRDAFVHLLSDPPTGLRLASCRTEPRPRRSMLVWPDTCRPTSASSASCGATCSSASSSASAGSRSRCFGRSGNVVARSACCARWAWPAVTWGGGSWARPPTSRSWASSAASASACCPPTSSQPARRRSTVSSRSPCRGWSSPC